MITVHHLETSRSHRVLWLLEELGVAYDIKHYKRDPKSRLAPPELKQIHPLGKSPVITDGTRVVAESGAIIEYLCQTYGGSSQNPELAHIVPAVGTEAFHQNRFWMHFAEGSLMNWLVMKLVFSSLPNQPMPFFVKPVAKGLCNAVQERLIDPNVSNAMKFINNHLESNKWFCGDEMSMADFQMSFAMEAALVRAPKSVDISAVKAYCKRLNERDAYKTAISKGGAVVMPSR